MKKIVMIVGSLRKNSFNRKLAMRVAGLLEGRAELSFLDFAHLPLMNQDIEFPTPDSVAEVRRKVMEADGLWIFSPEYNHQIPGGLKNLLDWLSRPLSPSDNSRNSAARGKALTISSVAGRSGGEYVRGHLQGLAQTMSMKLIGGTGTGIYLNGEILAGDDFSISEEKWEELKAQAEAFLAEI